VKIKFVILTLLFCLLVSTTKAAKRTKVPEMSIAATDWSDKLDLDDTQQERLKIIYAESQEKFNALVRQIEDLKKEIKELKEEDEQKIRNMLNAKQKIKFDKIKMRQQRNENGNTDSWKGKNKPSRKRMRQF